MDTVKITTEEMLDEALSRAETVEDVLDVANAMGLDMTQEELEAFVAEDTIGELSEDELDDVAGGWVGIMMLRCSQIMLRHAQARLRMAMFRVGYRTTGYSGSRMALLNYARRHLR